MTRVGNIPRLLCIALAASAACVLVSREAQAKGCTDHILTTVYSSQNRPSDIPKTRRVQRSKKLHAPSAAAQAMPKKGAMQPVVVVRANEKPYDPDFLEELEIEFVSFDLDMDDPRRVGLPQLHYIRIELGSIDTPVISPVVADLAFARPAFTTPLPLRI